MAEWLTWTVNEFSLKNVAFEKFTMDGANLCAMGKERFLDLAPDFVGDILWEHLETLQKGKAKSKLKVFSYVFYKQMNEESQYMFLVRIL